MPYNTRTYDTNGPHGSTPGAPPPFHARAIIQEPYDDLMVSDVAGQDDTLNPAGWVGVQSWQGGEPAYLGRDPYDPGTWQYPGDVLAEQPGMFTRLHQEAASAG